ncbi:MAG: response regulator [Ferruginibacter sp.]|nr:response regulator [Ferruginibacter sp.]
MVVTAFFASRIALYRYLFISSFFFINTLNAQTPFEYIGIENGLSNNSVTAIFKDRKGFMWFGTFDGLNRYDGYSFKVFRNKFNDSASLPHNYIYAINEDLYNNLWIGTGQGISIYNNLTSRLLPAFFIPYQSNTTEKITASITNIAVDANGSIFIGTNGRGLLVRLTGSDKTVQLPIKKGAEMFTYYNVQSIKIDKVHRVWVFIRDAGIYLLDAAGKELRLVNNSLKSANCMEEGDNGHLWIGSDEGLHQYDTRLNSLVKSYKEDAGSLSSEKILTVCFVKEKKLWIGTDGGAINILDPKSGEIKYLLPGHEKASLNSETVTAIYEDKNDRKWIGTIRGGINIVDPYKHRFQTVQRNPKGNNTLINNFVMSFFEDRQSNLWVGTDGGGLSIWNRRQNSFTNFRHDAANPASISNNFITSIKSDYLDNIWIASYGGGINRYNKTDRSFKHYACLDSLNDVENKNVLLLYEDKQKYLWAATFNQGRIYRLNRHTDRFEVFDQQLTDIISLTEDSNGSIWAGTASQLIKIDRKLKKHAFYSIGKPVRSVYQDKAGQLWLGTEGAGLLRFNQQDGSFLRYTTDNGLCNNSVLNILEDNKRQLWLSTFNGIASFNPQSKTFKNYYQHDGLQSNQFSYNAAYALSSGELAFGGIKGFNIFYPDSIRAVNTTPPVLLTAMRINNLPVEQDNAYVTKSSLDKIESLTIPFNKAILSFEFAALEYTAPNKISYAYYLEGWDKGWNYIGNTRTANYTHLSEGVYHLRIKATNAEGKWNSGEISIKVVIMPPWYRTWWAWLIYFLLIASAIYVYLVYKNRQAKLKYEIKLAHLDAQKEKELNEKKVAFFTNIAHEFRTPLSLIINPIKDILHKKGPDEENDELNIVYRNARRLLRLVDQLLLFKKSDSELDKLNIVQLNFNALCKEVYICFMQQARAKKIRYEFVCKNKGLELFVDREKVEIALFNLLSNAFKNTPENGRICFTVTEQENKVAISIEDTGCGIPVEAGDKLFEKFYQVKENNMRSVGFGIGLYLVKKFIAAHEGEISYKSKPGEGSTFFVTLPKGCKQANAPGFSGGIKQGSQLLHELNEEEIHETIPFADSKDQTQYELASDQQTLLLIDDDREILRYLAGIFSAGFKIYEANNGTTGLKLAHEHLPDLIICDIVMEGMGGIEFCQTLKMDSTVSHIPVILLTGSSDEVELKGIESGADDFIKKPFDKEILIARVGNILKNRNTVQKYFYNEITLQTNPHKISVEYKEFLENCLKIVEDHLDDKTFSIKTLAAEIGMSHSNLYKKVKSVSGQSVNGFIRFIRLRKAAEMFINTENNINETAYLVGFNDIKYFREQFYKVFDMNPSEYIKKYRKSFHNTHKLNVKTRK